MRSFEYVDPNNPKQTQKTEKNINLLKLGTDEKKIEQSKEQSKGKEKEKAYENDLRKLREKNINISKELIDLHRKMDVKKEELSAAQSELKSELEIKRQELSSIQGVMSAFLERLERKEEGSSNNEQKQLRESKENNSNLYRKANELKKELVSHTIEQKRFGKVQKKLNKTYETLAKNGLEEFEKKGLMHLEELEKERLMKQLEEMKNKIKKIETEIENIGKSIFNKEKEQQIVKKEIGDKAIAEMPTSSEKSEKKSVLVTGSSRYEKFFRKNEAEEKIINDWKDLRKSLDDKKNDIKELEKELEKELDANKEQLKEKEEKILEIVKKVTNEESVPDIQKKLEDLQYQKREDKDKIALLGNEKEPLEVVDWFKEKIDKIEKDLQIREIKYDRCVQYILSYPREDQIYKDEKKLFNLKMESIEVIHNILGSEQDMQERFPEDLENLKCRWKEDINKYDNRNKELRKLHESLSFTMGTYESFIERFNLGLDLKDHKKYINNLDANEEDLNKGKEKYNYKLSKDDFKLVSELKEKGEEINSEYFIEAREKLSRSAQNKIDNGLWNGNKSDKALIDMINQELSPDQKQKITQIVSDKYKDELISLKPKMERVSNLNVTTFIIEKIKANQFKWEINHILREITKAEDGKDIFRKEKFKIKKEINKKREQVREKLKNIKSFNGTIIPIKDLLGKVKEYQEKIDHLDEEKKQIEQQIKEFEGNNSSEIITKAKKEWLLGQTDLMTVQGALQTLFERT